MTIKTRFMPEEEYVKSFTDRGESVPPFLAFLPYEVRDGVPGYLVPEKPEEVNMPYFVISGDEDGDIYITEETEETLLKQLTPNEHGDADRDVKYVLDSVPTNYLSYWPAPFTLIIKGEIVTPKAKEVVTRFEV